jgi:hypothetical protein
MCAAFAEPFDEYDAGHTYIYVWQRPKGQLESEWENVLEDTDLRLTPEPTDLMIEFYTGDPDDEVNFSGLETFPTDNVKKIEVQDGIVHDLSPLRFVPGLEELILPWLTEVHDDGLAPLAALRNLRRLELASPYITDSGLRHLFAMTKLEELKVSGLVTEEGIATLRRALPGCHISPDDVHPPVTLRFPDDRSIGELRMEAPWGEATLNGNVRGDITVPGWAFVILAVDDPLYDLSFLRRLRPNDLYGLKFEGQVLTLDDVQHIAHLTELRQLSLE